MELLASQTFWLGFLAGVATVLIAYGVLLVVGVVIRPWAMAAAAGVPVGVPRLIGMKL